MCTYAYVNQMASSLTSDTQLKSIFHITLYTKVTWSTGHASSNVRWTFRWYRNCLFTSIQTLKSFHNFTEMHRPLWRYPVYSRGWDLSECARQTAQIPTVTLKVICQMVWRVLRSLMLSDSPHISWADVPCEYIYISIWHCWHMFV